MCANEPGRGPDVVIEAVGFHYTKSLLHTVEVVSGAAQKGGGGSRPDGPSSQFMATTL
jgi:hypothetical protein